MSLYQCEKCGCVENTACGHYWSAIFGREMFSDYQNGTNEKMLLCSACGPLKFKNGESTDFGKWHGIFRQRFFELNSLYTDGSGNVRFKGTDTYPTKEDEKK